MTKHSWEAVLEETDVNKKVNIFHNYVIYNRVSVHGKQAVQNGNVFGNISLR